MCKKILVFAALFAMSLSLPHFACSSPQREESNQQAESDQQAETADNTAVIFSILNHFAARNYAEGQVTEEEVGFIVQAGLRSTSAANRQPWFFSVVQDQDLVRQILPDATEGNILIVSSGNLGGTNRDAVLLDAGLAAQSMYIAAQAIGLGSRQYTNAALIGRANNLKAELGIPEDHTAIIVTRFGRLPDDVDVASSASPRADADTRVFYR